MSLIERQVFTTWYTPEEKLPPEGIIVVATVSGKKGKNITFDHAFALAEWYDDGEGWDLTDIKLDDLEIHAWADLEPYGCAE